MSGSRTMVPIGIIKVSNGFMVNRARDVRDGHHLDLREIFVFGTIAELQSWLGEYFAAPPFKDPPG